MEDYGHECHPAKPGQKRGPAQKTVIAISDLEFRFPRSDFHLAVPSLKIAPGESVAIIGPSGSGKTTLLHLISGILSPSSGTLRVLDRELNAMSDVARRAFRIARVGLVFQSFELIGYLDVFQNILLPYRLNPALSLTAEIESRAEQLARDTGIAHRLRYFPDRLSQGEKQRVAICRAMLPQPPLLLADEPTGQLDPLAKEKILDMLLQQVDHSGATLLMVTHDTEIAGRFLRVINCRDYSVGGAR